MAASFVSMLGRKRDSFVFEITFELPKSGNH